MPKRQTPLASSSPHAPILAPSLLAGRHAHLAMSAQVIQKAGAPWMHLDIMDGHFVPNLSFGPKVLAELRKESALFFDVHLMLDNPHQHIEAFAKAGANLISIHVEPNYPCAATLRRIRSLGCQNGIALNPRTSAASVRPYLTYVDLVLVMSVDPGFGGQAFDTAVLSKIAELDSWRQSEGYAYRLEVDGGIDNSTAQACAARGADTFVAGTAFFKETNPRSFTEKITQLSRLL